MAHPERCRETAPDGHSHSYRALDCPHLHGKATTRPMLTANAGIRDRTVDRAKSAAGEAGPVYTVDDTHAPRWAGQEIPRREAGQRRPGRGVHRSPGGR